VAIPEGGEAEEEVKDPATNRATSPKILAQKEP